MRRSPRRPLILKRRKLPFQHSEPPASQDASVPQGNPGSSSACQSFPDGVRILDHPHHPGTQVVVIPKTAELRSVIEALTVKGKEHGAQGPNKFILLGESGSLDAGSLDKTDQDSDFAGSAPGQQLSQSSVFTGVKQRKKEDDGRFNNSLTNIEWLERCDALLSGPSHDKSNKENQTAVAVLEETAPPVCEAACGSSLKKSGDCPQCDRAMKPPFSYMTMIQFAINSTKDGLMTLKEIYTWLEHHFDFFRDEKRQGWKNSVRHNLSLHEMFLRKTSPDKKVSFWTIRPEANRGLTLDQVYTPGCNPVAASFALPAASSPRQKTPPVSKKARTGSGSKRMKPILPQMPPFPVPIQLTLGASICLPSSSTPGPPAPPPAPAPAPARHTDGSPCKAKRRRNIPKVALLRDAAHRAKAPKAEMREEVACVTPQRGSPMTLARRRQAGSSRRKQRLVRKQHEEPLLLYTQTSDLDSSVVGEPELQEGRLHSYKTPIKAGRRLASSTPSKPLAELAGQSALDFSPIRTPAGSARTPLRDHAAFSVSPTPFKDWALFPDTGIACSGEPLLAGGGGSPPANRSLSEGLVLDTTTDSLSKILVDFSFSLDDMHELGLSDVSLSELMAQLA
ncbi:forkhead box protein M1 isoform X2 [Syngnathus acus]|uniref:forkhead box protein M1 isoform X2 n=1 Tax=Syngnathus acus TaxID=161584 RepID=UPI0018862A39|nr:forkhead box protein M1 isoform X2 [Syngnathus acus]